MADYNEHEAVFKTGDRVKVREGHASSGYFEIGDIGTITESGRYRSMVRIGMDRGGNYQFESKRFELIKKSKAHVDTGSYELKLGSVALMDLRRIYKETISNDVQCARVTVPEGCYLIVQEELLRHGLVRKGGKVILRKLAESGCIYFGPSTIKEPIPVGIPAWGKAYELVKQLKKAPLLKALKKDVVITIEPLSI